MVIHSPQYKGHWFIKGFSILMALLLASALLQVSEASPGTSPPEADFTADPPLGRFPLLCLWAAVIGGPKQMMYGAPPITAPLGH